jgi:glutamine synthetase
MHSPPFIRYHGNSATLIIPTAFVSWTGYYVISLRLLSLNLLSTGHAMDVKIPLLRSEEVICRESVRLLRLLGESVDKVESMMGAEQVRTGRKSGWYGAKKV